MGWAVKFAAGEVFTVLREVEYTFLDGFGETFFHRVADVLGHIEFFRATSCEIVMNVEGLLDSFEKVFEGELIFLEHLDEGVDDLKGFDGIVTIEDDLL